MKKLILATLTCLIGISAQAEAQDHEQKRPSYPIILRDVMFPGGSLGDYTNVQNSLLRAAQRTCQEKENSSAARLTRIKIELAANFRPSEERGLIAMTYPVVIAEARVTCQESK